MVRRLSVLPAARPWARRKAAFAFAVLAVLAVHAVLLVILAPAWVEPEEEAAPAAPLRVRSVMLPPVPAPAAPGVAAAPVPAPPAAPRRVAPPRRAASAVETAPAVTAAAVPPAGPAPAEAPVAAPPEAPVATVEAAADAAQAPAAIEVPVYATRLPPPGRWRYRLVRGFARGEAQLDWRPDDAGRYRLHLEGWIGGLSVLDWVSTGALDGAGIAPERFVIRRRGRDSQAANFQRDAGKITWSGPTHEVPLVAGVQDRLSWMVQLPAVIEADPARFGAGTDVVLMVIGARGGADVWTFQVVGTEPMEGTQALRLLREPRKSRDLKVEIWLDPARGHLPLRALLAQPDGSQPLELTPLQEGSTGP